MLIVLTAALALVVLVLTAVLWVFGPELVMHRRLRLAGLSPIAGGSPELDKGLNYYAGRAATYLGAVIAIGGGLLPILTNSDWQSTAGILAGLIAAQAVILKFIHGAQKHEDRVAILDTEFATGGFDRPPPGEGGVS